MIPHTSSSTRLFGEREEGWVNRKRSILDTISQDATALKKKLPSDDQVRVDEHLAGIRDPGAGDRRIAARVLAASKLRISMAT